MNSTSLNKKEAAKWRQLDKERQKIMTWACGHIGFPSIHPALDGSVQCTACANHHRFPFDCLPLN